MGKQWWYTLRLEGVVVWSSGGDLHRGAHGFCGARVFESFEIPLSWPPAGCLEVSWKENLWVHEPCWVSNLLRVQV